MKAASYSYAIIWALAYLLKWLLGDKDAKCQPKWNKITLTKSLL